MTPISPKIRFRAKRLRPDERYSGDVVVPSFWRGANPDGSENPLVEIRVLAEHPDGGWLYEWLHRGKKERCPKELGHCPDENLRRIFRPVGYEMEGATAPEEER